MTIASMKITLGAGVMAEEFKITDTTTKPEEMDASGTKLKADEGFDFQIRFYPIAGGDRKATLDIVTDIGKFSMPLAGKGQTEVALLSKGTVAWEKVFGGATTNEMTTGMAADKTGNVFFAANHTATANPRLLVGKVNADGTLAWSKTWANTFKSVSKDPGQNRA